jgi:hypothetical protein
MHSDERDARIDAALRSYVEPPDPSEPRVALAQVLERARAEKAPHWRWWVWLIPAGACVAGIVVAAMVLLMRGPRVPEIAWNPKPPGLASVATAPNQGVLSRAAARAVSLSARRVHRLPKLDMFPAPTPLSPQEQRLLAFASHTSPAAAQQLAEAQQHIDDPIQISPISIRPLDEDESTAQPNRKDNP